MYEVILAYQLMGLTVKECASDVESVDVEFFFKIDIKPVSKVISVCLRLGPLGV
ncbi:hypothetical protein ACFOEK_17250 [Litoribrevibacter euphylliae]|uniref:Uncharacterized protein n=1 Tax=Litoribrevibacter euphylliae TaxID=1834034 RepID=A0ABV7HJC9_9GAMM